MIWLVDVFQELDAAVPGFIPDSGNVACLMAAGITADRRLSHLAGLLRPIEPVVRTPRSQLSQVLRIMASLQRLRHQSDYDALASE
jgi:hypothetical protein